VKDQSISTIINYCSNDYCFIGKCIDQALKISPKVTVSYCDHFFDGTPEQDAIIKKTRMENEFKGVLFIEFAFNPKLNAPAKYWANAARYAGWKYGRSGSDWILFLDADEFIESERFNQWFEASHKDADAFLLGQFWYFREPIFQARTFEQNSLLIRNRILDKAALLQDTVTSNNKRLSERHSTWVRAPRHRHMQLGLDGNPMIHNYSWVKTKQQMIKKTSSWSHHTEADWHKKIEMEFSRPFNGTDFVHEYQYNIVENRFDINVKDVDAITFDQTYGGKEKQCHPTVIDYQKIMSMDLDYYANLIRAEEFHHYFKLAAGEEHYQLLAFLSTQFQDSILIDIGTYKGASALALAYNSSNSVISYDIVSSVALKARPMNIEFRVGNVLDDMDLLLKAPVIFLDADHKTKFENKVYQALVDHSYSGLLLLDDIHLTPKMERFWQFISHAKYDLTDIGHKVGTGLIDFSGCVKILK